MYIKTFISDNLQGFPGPTQKMELGVAHLTHGVLSKSKYTDSVTGRCGLSRCCGGRASIKQTMHFQLKYVKGFEFRSVSYQLKWHKMAKAM